jgi:hypothetical protein
LVATVAYHHRPSSLPAGILAAVRIADGLVDPEPYVTGDAARQGKARQGKLDQELFAQTICPSRIAELRSRVARLHGV